jgi:uncharacterized protein
MEFTTLCRTPSWQEFGLHIVVKPIGPICNLRCRYCFYLEKESLYESNESWRMTNETLEGYIRQYIEAQPAEVQDINFTFQGGEPTLMEIDFFRRALELQQKYLPPGKCVSNSLQTNGILLDDRWCKFLRDNRFLVGLSLDGPEDLHDAYRTDSLKRGSFERVMRAMRCLQKHEVRFNVIACVHRRNGDHPLRVYRFLRDSGVRYIQFIPVVQCANSTTPDNLPLSLQPEAWVTPESVLPKQFGLFLTTIFDEWAHHDIGRVQVGDFEQALMTWLGIGPSICMYKDICGRALALEHNGDLYACDHFVDSNHKLGNIHESTIARLVNSRKQERFGHAKTASLPSSCRKCEMRSFCNGGCPKDRFFRDTSGEPGLNFLCEGYRMLFTHIAPVIRVVGDALRAGRSPSLVMKQLQAECDRPSIDNQCLKTVLPQS